MPYPTQIVLQPDEILYREGDPNDCGYIVAEGEIILYSESNGGRQNCERRQAGSILGELSILTGQPRAVTVAALTPCVLYRIPARDILERFEGLDPILRACVDTSINFAAQLSQQNKPDNDAQVPIAQSTLRNADALIERMQFEQDILKGVSKNEFSMLYQPIMSLGDRQIVGCEALLRWQSKTRGHVSPDQFITVAEEMGAINLLTDIALEEACATLQSIENAQLSPDNNFFMSVNVSGADIGRKDFVNHVEHVLDRHDIHPQVLKLEVTETALVPDNTATDRNFQRLKALGCGISIDDFGTGYSNLAYLKSLPITALKIDRAFAADAHENAVSRGIVRMLIGLGRELDVDIIAEGLETPSDVAVLRELGCRFAQGYYFYKPMQASDLVGTLAEQLQSCGAPPRAQRS